MPEAPAIAIKLAENQRRIIEQRYLREDVSVEQWLRRVAHNIALAELLYHPASHLWGLFDGVRVLKKETFFGDLLLPKGDKVPVPATKTWLFHSGMNSAAERDKNFNRFQQNCERVAGANKEAAEAVREWEEKFFRLLSSWAFLPNSPTLMNAGRAIGQLSACFVLPVEDSMDGITHALQAQALIHKSGGGTGFYFGNIRPRGDVVKSTSGVASGVISFLQIFDKITDVVKQGGARRGANMGILPYWHPEIRDFIKLKSQPGILENFNLSVGVDEKFLEAYAKNSDFDLINPRTEKLVGKVSAREIFGLIVEGAWRTGDPGMVFFDAINNSNSNPTPGLGEILATNPCGEQPLFANEPCNLGSINLTQFVTRDNSNTVINWESLKESVFLGIRFLDNVIEINNFPLPEIELMAKSNRRIGLGVMGWAEMLVDLGIPYDSDRAVQTAEEVMGFINRAALEASEDLARERGPFPNWKDSVYDSAGTHFRGDARFPRHCSRTCIAPTGTIGLIAGLQGGGIEPFFGIAYTRYNARALENLKQGFNPDPKDVYFEVNPLFKKVAEENNFFGIEESELWRKIEKNRKSIRGISEIPGPIQGLFATAHDISVDFHVRIQAAFQKHVDNGVSKTVNMPHDASIQDVERAFLLAREWGCKGITIYRDGSRQEQVLNLVTGEKKVKKARDFSIGVSSEYYEVKTGYGPLHVHIDYDDSGPYRVFASLSPLGTEMAGLTSALGVVLSKYLEEGGEPNRILKHLQGVKGDRPYGLGKSRINSIPHALAIALKNHLAKHNWLAGASFDKTEPSPAAPGQQESIRPDPNLELWKLAQVTDQCPNCFSTNVSFETGCSGPTCRDCGYSECS